MKNIRDIIIVAFLGLLGFAGYLSWPASAAVPTMIFLLWLLIWGTDNAF